MAEETVATSGTHGDGDHSPHLAHHFESSGQQFDASKFGMWIFLCTEVLMFSGLFCAYAVYRANHPKIFEYQWIEMIKAGERSGTLAETIFELTDYIKTRRAVRGKVVSAMIYPCIMICVLIAALVLMLGKVVPTFGGLASVAADPRSRRTRPPYALQNLQLGASMAGRSRAAATT